MEEDIDQCFNRPLILPETFDKNGDFNEWISQFVDTADLNRWSESDKLWWLKVRLRHVIK